MSLSDLSSPDRWLFAVEHGEAILIPMDRASYRASIFLDARIVEAAGPVERVPVETLLAAAPPPQRIAWIFHVAHCGSTLLARALEELDDALVLREPLSLRQLGLEPDPQQLAAVLALLGRRYGGDVPTLVKANVPVNGLLPRIAAADPQAPAILLWSGLEDYLVAILRGPNHRGWVRGITDQLGARPWFGLAPVAGLGEAERAAALWLAQARLFAGALGAMPAARTLEAARFYADPAEVLARAARHVGRGADPARIAALVAGPLFNTYSKQPGVAFDNAARLAREADVRQALAGELTAGRRWIETHAPDAAELTRTLAAAAL